MKTVTQFSQAAKEFTQDDQLTDGLVKIWLEACFIEVFRSQKEWPHFQAKTTLTTTPGTDQYPFPTEGTKPWRLITDISHASKRGHGMVRKSPDAARRAFPVGVTGLPLAYAIWQKQILVFPTPDAVETFTVYGYRQPTDWMQEANGAPDLPDEWEPALLDYVLAKAAQYRADWESAYNHMADFSRKAETLTVDALGVDPGENITLGSYRPMSGLGPVAKFPGEL
jgi:hypothetical protein